MRTKRNTDRDTREHFRGDRFQCENGLWYFFTREKTLEGPFASRKCAEQYLQTYVSMAKILNGSAVASLSLEEIPEPVSVKGDRLKSNAKSWVMDPYHRRFGVAA